MIIYTRAPQQCDILQLIWNTNDNKGTLGITISYFSYGKKDELIIKAAK